MLARNAIPTPFFYLCSLSLVLLLTTSCAKPAHTPLDRGVASNPIRNGLRGMMDDAAAYDAASDTTAPNLASILADNAVLLAAESESPSSSTQTSAPNTLIANLGPLPITTEQADATPLIPLSISATPERNIEQPTIAAAQNTTERIIEQTPEQRRAQLIEELASMLRQESRTSATPTQSVTQLAALETLEPGILTDSVLQSSSLTQREQEVIKAWRTMLRAVGEETRSASGDVSLIPRAIADAHLDLGSGKGLTIAQATLCSRVEGFGRYTELPDKLLAGRTHPAIVYVELENFASRPATDARGNTAHTVEIGQEISLYHDADGLLAWKQAEQIVTDTSRSERHDFFLVHRIDLPQTLTVGIYKLKITVQDKVSGHAAEIILPLEVVADANLIRTFR